jgi:ribokinase
MPRGGDILVIGSVNTDLVCRTPHVPAPGETVLGSDLATIHGGKGANQAVAAARLGGRVRMVGRVGDDDAGKRLREGLRNNGVGVKHVRVTPGVSSGCAMILVDKRGENSIVVAPGANARVTPADVDAALPLLRRAAVVVLQLEIPLPTVRHAIATCRRLGVPTILDPAPVPPRGLPRELFAVDVLTPNQIEAQLLARPGSVPAHALGAPGRIGRGLLAKGAGAVVLKLGARGSFYADRAGAAGSARAFKVEVVDSTAAGDAFTGALAVAMSEGRGLVDALPFANAAGALCCTGYGAQPSLPTRRDVERFMEGSSRVAPTWTPRAAAAPQRVALSPSRTSRRS